MKHLLMIWIGRDKMFNSRSYRITSIREANKRQESLASQIPKDIFSRRPRILDYVMFWKATEYRQFLLYTGHIILKDLLAPTFYRSFLMLNAVSLILLRPNADTQTVQYAKGLLNYFIQVLISYTTFIINILIDNMILILYRIANKFMDMIS